MTWVAVAIGGSALLGAAASGSAASKAAKGADAATQLQRDIYNQNREDLAPYRATGGDALNAYARAMGLPTQGAGGSATDAYGRSLDASTTYQYKQSGIAQPTDVQKAFQEFLGRAPTKNELDYYTDKKSRGKAEPGRGDQLYYDVIQPGLARMQKEAEAAAPAPGAAEGPAAAEGATGAEPAPGEYGGFTTSPGYEWRLEQGNRALDRNFAARSGYLSGAREKAAMEYNQGVASDEFGNYMNRLAGAAGIGQTAVNTGVQSGNYYAQNAGNSMQNAGNARASGYLGVGNTLINAANNYGAYRGMQQPQGYSSAVNEWGGGGGYTLKGGLQR